ncbi:MAG TPA: YrzE family protein [Candidatus Deferrimicrobium sp.]|nr:YrzE family protein [Candidatus Deferrimicrobium sp.]
MVGTNNIKEKKLKDTKKAEEKKLKVKKKAEETKLKDTTKTEDKKLKDSKKAEDTKLKDTTKTEDTKLRDTTKAEDTKLKDTTKAEDKKLKDTKTDKMVKAVAGKLIAGIIVCMVAIPLIILIVTLGFSLAKVEALETLVGQDFPINNVVQGIFILGPHSISFLTTGFWSIIAANLAGAYIGGLVVRSGKKGILVGIISFGLFIFLQLAIGFLFNINTYIEWFTKVSLAGGNVLMDFLMSATLLMAAGAVGGMLSRE